MAQPELVTIREAVRLAVELADTAIADVPDGGRAFEIVFDGDESRWFGAFEESGATLGSLFIARGLEGLRWIREVATNDAPADLAKRVVVYSVEITVPEDLEDRTRDLLRRAGVVSEMVADIEIRERGRAPCFPDRSGLRRVVNTLRALLAVSRTTDALPAADDAAQIPVLRVSGDLRSPAVAVSIEPLRDPEGLSIARPHMNARFHEVLDREGSWVAVAVDCSAISEAPDCSGEDAGGQAGAGGHPETGATSSGAPPAPTPAAPAAPTASAECTATTAAPDGAGTRPSRPDAQSADDDVPDVVGTVAEFDRTYDEMEAEGLLDDEDEFGDEFYEDEEEDEDLHPDGPALLIIDRASRQILCTEPLADLSPSRIANAILRGDWFDDVGYEPALPATLAVSPPEVAELVRRPLEAARVRCESVGAAEGEEIAAAALGRRHTPQGPDALRRLGDDDPESEPGHRLYFVAADLEAALDDELEEEELPDVAAATRYFDCAEEELAEEFEMDGQLRDWTAIRHRRSPDAQTIAERLLAENRLGPELAEVLQARVAAVPTLARVLSVEPAGDRAVVSDVFDGVERTVVLAGQEVAPESGEILLLELSHVGPVPIAWELGARVDEEDLSNVLRALGVTHDAPRPARDAFGPARHQLTKQAQAHEDHDGDFACDDPHCESSHGS